MRAHCDVNRYLFIPLRLTFSDQVKKEWEDRKSVRVNLKRMGLAYDANEAVRIPNVKQEMLEDAKSRVAGDEDSSGREGEKVSVTAAKGHVAEKLEAEARAPRERLLKLPKGQAQFLSYLIKKHGEDYQVRFFSLQVRFVVVPWK